MSLIGSLGLSQAADDSGFPRLNEGKWETTSITQLQGHQPEKSGTITYDCVQPILSMKQEIAMLEKSGCKASSVTRSGDEYRYTVSCGAGGTNRYTLKAKSQDEFIHTVFSEKTGDISIDTGRRVRNCKTAAQQGAASATPKGVRSELGR
jgi:Protein of unknown function (DUF3617)